MTDSRPAAGRADAIRCTSTGAFATLGMFALCWILVLLGMPLSATHGFVGLFTMQPVGTTNALWTGALWAFLAGGVAGAIIAHCYNLAGRILGR
jgi:hypothetical protein